MFPRPLTTPEQALAALMACFAGAAFGLMLGLADGFILAFPLAAIFG